MALYRASSVSDNESLQTDIMRVFSIVLICLMAIFLSSVQQVKQPLQPAAPSPVAHSPATEEPIFSPPEAPSSEMKDPVEDSPPDVIEPSKELTLRFASDQAFIELIKGGQVQAYLEIEEEAYQLTSSFRVLPYQGGARHQPVTQIPDRLSRISSKLEKGKGVAQWGVVFNPSIRTAIEGFVQQHKNGELVIHHGGDVRFSP